MCTLTLVAKERNGYILTFNRDEVKERSATLIYHDMEKGIYYPKDPQHGGTWFAFQPQKGRFVCLLNGAFIIHKRQLPYRKSRGLIVLEAIASDSIQEFLDNYDLGNIEPFTMLINDGDGIDKTIELRWDGIKKHIKTISSDNAIYSSCTLYDTIAAETRKNWFDQFMAEKNGQVDETDLWHFHQSSVQNKEAISIMMTRSPKEPKTISTSQLTYDAVNKTIDFRYYEVISKKLQSISLSTESSDSKRQLSAI
jgi:hypothetical protein